MCLKSTHIDGDKELLSTEWKFQGITPVHKTQVVHPQIMEVSWTIVLIKSGEKNNNNKKIYVWFAKILGDFGWPKPLILWIFGLTLTHRIRKSLQVTI